MTALVRETVETLGRLRESGIALVGAGLIVFWVFVAVFAPLLAPFDPLATLMPFQTPGAVFEETGQVFWLGTDQLGRDILSRTIFGARQVLLYAPAAAAAAYAVGIAGGLVAGYKGGWWDVALSRLADIVLSFPVLVLYVVIIGAIGATAANIFLAITFATAPGVFRIVRGLALDLKTRDYVAAAETRGEALWYILFVEILPNARGPLIVDACLRLGYIVITIGVLAFLGLGLPPPDPDWGLMVAEARAVALAFPHMTLAPCLALSSLVLGLNLLADGLRDITERG